jgi:hypothetical protein
LRHAPASSPPATCAVARIVEVKGPRGGTIQVLYLRCGCWVTRRLKAGAPPPVAIFCIGCHVRRQLGEPPAPPD